MKTIKTSIILAFLGALFTTGCLTDGPISESRSEVSGRPYFEVFRSDSGRYYFNLSAANHEIMLASQSYSTRTAALGGVLSVLDNSAYPERFQLKQAKDGSWYFNLKAANGQVIGTSEMYSTKGNAKAGIDAVEEAIGDYLAFLAVRTGARFEVFEGKDGRYFFNLHAGNGEIVLSSQGYTSQASALNGTFSVADNGVNPERYDLRQAANGGFYFNVMASNGQVVGTSEVYSTKSNAQRAINSIIELLPQVDLL